MSQGEACIEQELSPSETCSYHKGSQGEACIGQELSPAEAGGYQEVPQGEARPEQELSHGDAGSYQEMSGWDKSIEKELSHGDISSSLDLLTGMNAARKSCPQKTSIATKTFQTGKGLSKGLPKEKSVAPKMCLTGKNAATCPMEKLRVTRNHRTGKSTLAKSFLKRKIPVTGCLQAAVRHPL